MMEIKGHKIDSTFVQNFVKVYDLIEYEGPFLSHFVDEKKRNYFYLWVDNNEISNRWLIWRVNDLELHKYLKGKISLRDLLLAPTKDFIYVADIDGKLNYLNLVASDINDISEKYIPEFNSFCLLELDGEHPYSSYVDEKNRDFYYSSLIDNSIYLKIQNPNDKHGTSVGLAEINQFISSINSSYKNFLMVDFIKAFGNDISDETRLNAMFSSAYDALDLRAIEFEHSSFIIGLALDKIMIGSSIGDFKMKMWAGSVLNKFSKDVIEIDYNKDSEIHRIVETYSEDQRSKIYTPLIKLTKNKKIKFSFREKSLQKNYKRINIKDDKALKIVPKIIKEVIKPEYELLNVLAVVKKGDKIITLTDQNTLFSVRDNESVFKIKSDDFIKEGYDIILEDDIDVEANVLNTGITMFAYVKGILITATSSDTKKTKTELIKMIYKELTKEEV